MIGKIIWFIFWTWIVADVIGAFGDAVKWGLRKWAKKTDDPKKALVLAAMWGILEIHGWRTGLMAGKLAWEQFRKGKVDA